MKWFKFICFFVLCLVSSALYAQQNPDYNAYINHFDDIAVSEMYRSGIPASITLAQGLLESGAGKSHLAVKSNNHFGIKCHNGWQGGRVYHDDDAKGECFRGYDKPEESYRDHSDFLRYRDRYRFLFDYELTDYKSWAYGLKQAGYATDPRYPAKLIDIIEKYELYKYDTRKPAVKVTCQTIEKEMAVTPPPPPSQIEQVAPLEPGKREIFRFSLTREIFTQNGVPFIYVTEGETLESIAKANGLFVREILKFNDLKGRVDLKAGTVIYLQKKKNSAIKGLEMHVIEKGETLRGIAQRYGVRMKSLCRINALDNPDLIREGDIIRLRK